MHGVDAGVLWEPVCDAAEDFGERWHHHALTKNRRAGVGGPAVAPHVHFLIAPESSPRSHVKWRGEQHARVDATNAIALKPVSQGKGPQLDSDRGKRFLFQAAAVFYLFYAVLNLGC